MIHRLLPALAVTLLVPHARAEAPRTGVLPVVGGNAALVDPALGRALAEQGVQAALGPVELQARLAALPQVAGALARTREAISLAREHELQMSRAAAVHAAREAISRLDAVRGRIHAPRLAVRAHVTLALALQLRPADPAAARQALREALRIDPGYRPEPGQLSPRDAALLEEQRAVVAEPHEPAASDLSWLADQLELKRLVWIGLQGEQARVLLYDHAAGRIVRRARGVASPRRVLPALARLVSQTIGVARRQEPPRPAPPPPTPWYRRWWVWTAVGAVAVAGAAVGIGLALRGAEDEPGYDFRFHF